MKRVAVMLVVLVACADSADDIPTYHECSADRDCDDSIACTVDRCVMTVNGFKRCDNTPDDDLCPDGLLCMSESLLGAGCRDPLALACADANEGDRCVPPDACSISDGHCESGLCVFTRLKCPERPCMTTRGCDAATGICSYTIASDDEPCDADGDRCTDDRCYGGRCVQGEDTCECSDSRPCVQPTNLCMGQPVCRDGACLQEAVDCSPYNTDCLVNYCLPSTGLCEPMIVNEGADCADDLACTGPGTCHAGACVAGPLECPAKPCNTVKCVEPKGCVYTPASGDCDDGNACNGPDACSDGSCLPVGDGVSCDDLNQCTVDDCIPSSGLCRHTPIDGCCGNSILEAGEECDGTDIPDSGCQSCGFTVVSLDFGGASPAYAWSPQLSSGLVTWEVVDEGGGHGIVVRVLTSLGTFGRTLPVPAGTVSGRSMSPCAAATDNGFILGALTAKAPQFFLLDASGRPRITTAVSNLYSGGTPTGRMVMARSDVRSVAAWTVSGDDGSQQLLYADIADGPDQILVSGAAVLFETGPGGGIIPGDACAVADGVVVTFAARSEEASASVVVQKAAYFKAGESSVKVWDLASSQWDQSYPSSCVKADSGFLAVYTRLEREPDLRIVVEGRFTDVEDGPGLPFELESIIGDNGVQVLPFSSDLVADGLNGFLYVCPLVEPSISMPEKVSPAVITISSAGVVTSGPVPLDGPGLAFAGGLSAGVAVGSALSVFWVETSDITEIYGGGQVAGRLYQSSGL